MLKFDLNLKKIKAVLWDVNGVLVKENKLKVSVFKKMFEISEISYKNISFENYNKFEIINFLLDKKKTLNRDELKLLFNDLMNKEICEKNIIEKESDLLETLLF